MFVDDLDKINIKKIEKTLLPCPFCESKAEVKLRYGNSDYDYGEVFFDIRCINKKCYLQDGAEWHSDNTNEVVKMWNKRKINKKRIQKIYKIFDDKK